MARALSGRSVAPDGPSTNAVAVTPSDVADLATYARQLWIGGSGNVNVDTLDGTTVVFTGVPAGVVLPIAVKKVHATSTTATNIVALL